MEGPCSISQMTVSAIHARLSIYSSGQGDWVSWIPTTLIAVSMSLLLPELSYGHLTIRNGFLILENVENDVSHAYIAHFFVNLTCQGGHIKDGRQGGHLNCCII